MHPSRTSRCGSRLRAGRPPRGPVPNYLDVKLSVWPSLMTTYLDVKLPGAAGLLPMPAG